MEGESETETSVPFFLPFSDKKLRMGPCQIFFAIMFHTSVQLIFFFNCHVNSDKKDEI